jgi:putative oxidoreductase
MSSVATAADNAESRQLDPMRMPGRLIYTDADSAMLVLRVSLALILFPHGAQHMVGWFGGYGFAGTHAWMTDTLGFPGALAALAIITEFFAPFALLAGVLSRVAAAGVIGLMIGAISTHVEHGFFMNWFGTLPAGAEGYEYHLLVIAIAVAVLMRGSGRWSIDRALTLRLIRVHDSYVDTTASGRTCSDRPPHVSGTGTAPCELELS